MIVDGFLMQTLETRIHMFLGNVGSVRRQLSIGLQSCNVDLHARTKTPGLVQTLGGEEES